MSVSVWLSVFGVALLQLDSWVLRTNWLALLGFVMLVGSMYLLFKEDK